MNKPNIDPKRLDGETYEDYKLRQKAVSLWMKTRDKFFHISKYVSDNEARVKSIRPMTYRKAGEARA